MHAYIRPIFSSLIFLLLFLTAGAVNAAGSLSGTVTEHGTNVPLQGMQVLLFRGDDPNSAGEHDAWIYVATTPTNADGEYLFPNLDPRQYSVHIEPGSTDISGKHFVRADLYNVQVLEGAETSGMDLELREAGYIWGYVKTDSGDPISNARVIGHGQWTEDGRDWHHVTTDLNGRYELWILPSPGEFYEVSSEDGWLGGAQYEAQYAPGLYQATIQGVHGPDFTLAEGGCIQGRIVNEQGEGIPNIEVDSRIGNLDNPHARTDVQGYYTLSNLPVTSQAYVYIDQWDLMPALLNGVKYGSGKRFVGPLTVTTGSCSQAPDMVMLVAGAVEGVVTDTAGVPIVGAEIEIEGFDLDGNELNQDEVYTDALGQYTFDFLPPGEYTVQATKDGWVMASQSKIVVVSGELTDVDLVMRQSAQGAVISGSIIDYQANTCRKDSAGVLLPNYLDNDVYVGNERACDVDLVALPDDLVFRALEPVKILGEAEIADGYADYFQPQPAEIVGDYQLALPPGGADVLLLSWHETDRGEYVLFHDHKWWDLSEGETLTGQDFQLPSDENSGVLEGVINYPVGAAFNPGKTAILAFNETTPSSFAFGDALAEPDFMPAYRIGKLPAGSYTLRVFSDGFVDKTYEGVVVTSGATKVQDITLETGATLSGLVTDAATGLPLAGARVEITNNNKAGVSESDGSYSVRGLAPDDSNLLVTKPGYADFNAVVAITVPTTIYDIALDSLAGSIAGSVVDENAVAVNDAQVVAYNPSLDIYKSGNTIGGSFAIDDLPAGNYVLGIKATGYGVVQYPETGVLTLSPDQDLVISNSIEVRPAAPLFNSTSTVSDTGGVINLDVSITSDMNLLSTPTIVVRGQDTSAGCSAFNVQQVTVSKYSVSCEVVNGESLVWIDISEGSVPVITGNPATASFSFEVGTNLLSTSSTNFDNAIGGDTTIMGTQDNTKVYVPPFALAGAGTQAVVLTVKRYGNPGDAAANTSNQTASAVYDFSFENGEVQIDTNHVVTIMLQFEKPADMSEADFEADLKIGYFRVSDQQWVYSTDPGSGISNIHINWMNNTITFDASHFTRFAAFLPAIIVIPGDFDGDGDTDRDDLNILLLDRNKTVEESSCGTACDLDNDGVITVLDARKLFLLCSRTRCATE